MNNNDLLLDFLTKSPTCYHAVENLSKILEENGYKKLEENVKWGLVAGGKYYTKRNGSSIIAFSVPNKLDNPSLNISASHTDSPCFKIKPNYDLVQAGYSMLNTEMYGGAILSTWLDRPLSIAGRVTYKDKGIKTKLINIDRDLLVIPNCAPHMNPEINNGYKYNLQRDMMPLFKDFSDEVSLSKLIAEELGISEDKIISKDLFLYLRDNGHYIGAGGEYILSKRLDDLAAAFGCALGFVKADAKAFNVFACFDNEEVGSRTKQGAASTFLYDVLKRAFINLGYDEEDLNIAISNGLLVSADNAHAVHPNLCNLTDQTNKCFMNKGIVIKTNANQNYTTDAISQGLFQEVCDMVNVPFQYFANRSDIRGGGTLGAISTSQVSINTVDIGLAQLAMHSSCELMGSKDLDYLISAMECFYSVKIERTSDSNYTITK